MSAISFEIERRATTGGGRAGTITTPHGTIRTPAFTPVGTKANVKGILPSALRSLGAEVVLANTYHLYLQPGEKVVQATGGLGKFMSWTDPPPPIGSGEAKPTMTDSGGFQVFSLGAAFGKTISKFTKGEARHTGSVSGEVTEKQDQIAVYDESVASQSVGGGSASGGHGKPAIIDDEGVSFTSHLDGSLHRFTPERSVEIQHALGADIFFAFDECTSPNEPYDYQREAMERTHRWADRSLKAHREMEYQKLKAGLPAEASARRQAIFGIVQGGRHEDLRRESARAIAALGFDGIGIGGSFSKEDMKSALAAAVNELPDGLPRHFLGIGEPGDILEGIASGMDLFDCVAPTRIGRHGSIYTRQGIIHLKNGKYRNDFTSLWRLNLPHGEGGLTSTGEFTLAYVSHLVRAGEMIGSVICSMHNVGFILDLVAGARQAILDGRFDDYRADFVRNYYQARQ